MPQCLRNAVRLLPCRRARAFHGLLACADDLDFHATVLCAAFASCVGSDWAGFALAFRVNAISRNTLADQIVLDGVGATLGQTLVVLFATDGVGVTHGN